MSKAFLAINKLGDSVSILPLLWHEHQRTSQPVTVVVSEQYASLFDRLPYVKPVVFPGKWYELEDALKWAKERFNEVVPLTVYGDGFPIEHRTSSFQLEPWERVGMLGEWDGIEMQQHSRNRPPMVPPSILFADHSESSPFLQKEELFRLLVDNFPKHDIVRLSGVQVEHPFDLVICHYSTADALVTIDTAHIHLSQFTKTPVFALANDKPTKWNGSAWSKRFAFYCRYGEFNDRKDELIESMRATLSGWVKPEVVELN